jgi:hypothetical protein
MQSTDTSKRSSNIARVDYEPAGQHVTITFKSGGSYRYHDVSPAEHAQFIGSKSLGQAFNKMFYAQPKRHPAQKLSATQNELSGDALKVKDDDNG